METEAVTRQTYREDAIVVEDAPSVAVDPPNLLSWGSVWAGLLSAFGVFVLLTLVAVAAGLETAPVADLPENLDVVASIATGVFVVLAFAIGGFIAAWTATLSDPGQAILHGFLVWALFVMVLLVMVSLGLGGALGSATRVFTGEFDPQGAADAFSDAAWGAVFVFVLAMAASIMGALLATRDEIRAVKWPAYR